MNLSARKRVLGASGQLNHLYLFGTQTLLDLPPCPQSTGWNCYHNDHSDGIRGHLVFLPCQLIHQRPSVLWRQGATQIQNN
jgi:hypothetical protein